MSFLTSISNWCWKGGIFNIILLTLVLNHKVQRQFIDPIQKPQGCPPSSTQQFGFPPSQMPLNTINNMRKSLFLTLPEKKGNPWYLSNFIVWLKPIMLVNSSFFIIEIFLEAMKRDLWILTRTPRALQKSSRTCCTNLTCEIFAPVNKRQSFVKNKWDTWGPFLEILTDCHWSLWNFSWISKANFSMQRTNK